MKKYFIIIFLFINQQILFANIIENKFHRFENYIDTKDMSNELRIKLVNNFFNSFPYKSDITYLKKEDKWLSLNDFIQNNGGDCEDFAISKLSILKKYYKTEDLYLSYGYLKNKNKTPHMVALIKDKDDFIVLDNYHKNIYKLKNNSVIDPVYFISLKDYSYLFFKNNELIKVENGKSEKLEKLLTSL